MAKEPQEGRTEKTGTRKDIQFDELAWLSDERVVHKQQVGLEPEASDRFLDGGTNVGERDRVTVIDLRDCVHK